MNDSSLPLTDGVRDVIRRSIWKAHRVGCTEPNGAHVLMSLSEKPLTFAKYILNNVGIDADNLRHVIEGIFRECIADAPPSDTMAAIVERARFNAISRHCPFVGDEHLLLSVLELAGPVVRLAFERLGVSLEAATACTEKLSREMAHRDRVRRLGWRSLARRRIRVTRKGFLLWLFCLTCVLVVVQHHYSQRIAAHKAQFYCERGIHWLREGQYDKAIAGFDEALHFDPGLTEASHFRAMAVHKKATAVKGKE